MAFIPDKDYAFIYNQVPRLCVDLAIKDKHGALLLTRRDIPPYKGLWHLPGGGIKFKETIAEAASRIAKKEFGVEVRLARAIGPCEIMNDDLDADNPRHSVSIVCETEIVSGTPQKSDETAEVQYFIELPEAMHPYHGPFIKEHKLF
ncbi:MAG: NUDIX domain-containing protein [bacterium]|nr:NUDIX domain-containing protein [bacterium]